MSERILHGDEDAKWRELFARELSAYGYEVDSAASQEEFLALAQQHDYVAAVVHERPQKSTQKSTQKSAIRNPQSKIRKGFDAWKLQEQLPEELRRRLTTIATMNDTLKQLHYRGVMDSLIAQSPQKREEFHANNILCYLPPALADEHKESLREHFAAQGGMAVFARSLNELLRRGAEFDVLVAYHAPGSNERAFNQFLKRLAAEDPPTLLLIVDQTTNKALFIPNVDFAYREYAVSKTQKVRHIMAVR